MPKKNIQRGGSAFMQNFYASTVVGGPAAISHVLLQGINQAPMFQPLSTTAVVPGTVASSGIVPSGLYLAGMQPLIQSGGMPPISTQELRDTCVKYGINPYTDSGKPKGRQTLLNQLHKAVQARPLQIVS
jgi:hypothetical protein